MQTRPTSTSTTSVAENGFSPAALRQQWRQVSAADPDVIAQASSVTGVDFAAAGGRVWETDDFVYLPVVVNLRDGDIIPREPIVFAFSDELLVTLQPSTPFPPFGKAIARIRRTPELAHSPHGVMYALLYALNEASERVIDHASDALEAMNDEIAMATNGYDRRGKEIGVSDMQDTIARMNEAEEIVS